MKKCLLLEFLTWGRNLWHTICGKRHLIYDDNESPLILYSERSSKWSCGRKSYFCCCYFDCICCICKICANNHDINEIAWVEVTQNNNDCAKVDEDYQGADLYEDSWQKTGKKMASPCVSDSVPGSGKRSPSRGSDWIGILQGW